MFLYWVKRKSYSDVKTQGYVGITKFPDKRLAGHKKKTNPKFSNALAKYNDIELIVLFEGSENYCKFLENKLRNDFNIGWNLVPGGGLPPTFPGKNKGNKNWLGKKHSPETKEKCRLSNLGRKRTKEQKKNLSEAHKGQKAWNKGTKGIMKAWNKGIPMTEETKKKLLEGKLKKRLQNNNNNKQLEGIF